MEPATIAVTTYAGLTIGSIAAADAVLSRGAGERTETHTVEIYHGCHWSSWLTPGQNRCYTALMGAGATVAFLGAIAIVIGTPLLSG